MARVDLELYSLAARVGEACRRSELRLVTAESCTGGWVAACITDCPGSSEWFDRGFVTYSNEAKQEMLGVPRQVLDRHGAVSEETVEAMVSAALERSHAQVAVAISGIAGPTGGSPEKPVGLVWFAWRRLGVAPRTRRELFPGPREAVRRQAVSAALRGLLELCQP